DGPSAECTVGARNGRACLRAWPPAWWSIGWAVVGVRADVVALLRDGNAAVGQRRSTRLFHDAGTLCGLDASERRKPSRRRCRSFWTEVVDAAHVWRTRAWLSDEGTDRRAARGHDGRSVPRA